MKEALLAGVFTVVAFALFLVMAAITALVGFRVYQVIEHWRKP